MEATALVNPSRRKSRRAKAAVRGKAPAKQTKPKRAQTERMVKPKTQKTTPMLSFRMDVATRELVDRAAMAKGQNRTDFMVTTLREKAIEILLNQRLFSLDNAAWSAFAESLDNPPPPNAKLKALLAREPIWERQ